MKNTLKFGLFAFLGLVMASCFQEDPGPRQDDQRTYSVLDFDRLEVSEAIEITVAQGSTFAISAQGDRRNLDDLNIYKNGTTLVMKFRGNNNRQYTTYVTVTMPALQGMSLSGAVKGSATGFSETARFDLVLSGASILQFNADIEDLHGDLTGASELRLNGKGHVVDVSVSGASSLSAFDFPVDEAKLLVTGASHARINASQKLTVSASGASDVLYRGTPQIDSNITGASTFNKD